MCAESALMLIDRFPIDIIFSTCAESAQVPIRKPTCSKMEHLEITCSIVRKTHFALFFNVSTTEESSAIAKFVQ